MSFFRHAGIYRSDGDHRTRGGAPPPVGRPPSPVKERDGRNNAFCSSSAMSSRVGYSLAGCSPAEPASASPTASSMRWRFTAGNVLPANGNLSLVPVSQRRGSLHMAEPAPIRTTSTFLPPETFSVDVAQTLLSAASRPISTLFSLHEVH